MRWQDTVRGRLSKHMGPVALSGRGMVYMYTGLGSDRRFFRWTWGS